MRPRARRHTTHERAADVLGRVAPLASRWIERLLAGHEPPLTLAQYLALQGAADGELVGAEVARRAAISPAAVSQLLGGLERAGLLNRVPTREDRRRHTLALSERGEQAFRSAQTLLRERLSLFLADVPDPEAEVLVRLLRAVEASLAGTAPPPRPSRTPPPPHGHRKPHHGSKT